MWASGKVLQGSHNNFGTTEMMAVACKKQNYLQKGLMQGSEKLMLAINVKCATPSLHGSVM
jgi:hypothetical protein